MPSQTNAKFLCTAAFNFAIHFINHVPSEVAKIYAGTKKKSGTHCASRGMNKITNNMNGRLLGNVYTYKQIQNQLKTVFILQGII